MDHATFVDGIVESRHAVGRGIRILATDHRYGSRTVLQCRLFGARWIGIRDTAFVGELLRRIVQINPRMHRHGRRRSDRASATHSDQCRVIISKYSHTGDRILAIMVTHDGRRTTVRRHGQFQHRFGSLLVPDRVGKSGFIGTRHGGDAVRRGQSVHVGDGRTDGRQSVRNRRTRGPVRHLRRRGGHELAVLLFASTGNVGTNTGRIGRQESHAVVLLLFAHGIAGATTATVTTAATTTTCIF